MIEQQYPVAVFTDAVQIVADKQNCLALLLEFFELPITLCLEKDVPDRQCLIDNQNLRIDIDRHSKSQPHKHTAGVRLDRLVHKVADIGKVQNILQSRIDLFLGKADHRPLQIDVLHARIFHVKSCAKLEQRGNPTVHDHLSGRRIQHAGDNLQDRRLPGSVRTDDPNCLTLRHLKIHIRQCIVLPITFLSGQPKALL